MKKKLLILFSAVLVAFTSCKKDNDTDADSGGSSGTYFPTSQGTERVYKITSGTSSSTATETMTGVTKTINGGTYYEANNVAPGMSGKVYYYANDGIYRLNGTSLEYGINIEFEFLHANDAVGSTWTKTVTASGLVEGVPARMIGTIKEKDITKEVLGKTYKNVIHSTVQLQYNMGNGYETWTTYEFYVAKGVGVITLETNIDFYGITMSSKNELQSYIIK